MLSKALQRRHPLTRLTENGGSSLPHVACSVLNGHHVCCTSSTLLPRHYHFHLASTGAVRRVSPTAAGLALQS